VERKGGRPSSSSGWKTAEHDDDDSRVNVAVNVFLREVLKCEIQESAGATVAQW